MTAPTRPRLALLRRTRFPRIRLIRARRARRMQSDGTRPLRPRRRLARFLAVPLLAAFAFAGGYAAETSPSPARPPAAEPPPMTAAPPLASAVGTVAATAARPQPDAAQVVADRIDLPRWDDDRDGLVNPAEFARGLFAMADLDQDQRLTAAEFEAARAWLPGEPDPETIDRWDRDGDGLLDPRAFTAGVIIDELASGWDLDGDRRLRRPEIAEGLRLAFDRNGDGHLQPDEQASIARSPQ